MQSCIHIRQKMSTQIYLYSYSPNCVDPNIFVFIFGPKNGICHALMAFQKKVFFVRWPNWQWFVIPFLLLPSKVKADVINDLQYHGAKMAMKSDMYVTNGCNI